jgi:Methyltransferase domain
LPTGPLRKLLRQLPPQWQDRLRRLNRLRWLQKARLARAYGAPFREHPLDVARYVLWDPEVGDFSYELADEGEFVTRLAGAFDLDPAVLAGYVEETRTDPALTSELAERTRRRLDMKRRPTFGPRIAWYALVRALKPRVVVETGIKHGLGSLILLVALRRNAEEGGEGRLISFDTDPFSGWVVPEDLRGGWQPVFASTFDAMESTLAGVEVDLFICDTPPSDEIESFEVGVALRHAAPGIVLIAGSGNRTTALRELVLEAGGVYSYLPERPRHAVYPGAGLGLASLMRPVSLPAG